MCLLYTFLTEQNTTYNLSKLQLKGSYGLKSEEVGEVSTRTELMINLLLSFIPERSSRQQHTHCRLLLSGTRTSTWLLFWVKLLISMSFSPWVSLKCYLYLISRIIILKSVWITCFSADTINCVKLIYFFWNHAGCLKCRLDSDWV